jgi:hypothetical protein
MSATKIDFKRALSELYSPGSEPALVDVPDLAFLMVEGHGDPNTSVEYRAAVEALYAVSYTAKFAIKRTAGGIDFTVMPLEGLWWVPGTSKFPLEDKSGWHWTAMIMQPEPVTAAVIELAIQTTKVKKSPAAVELVRFERFREGLAAQVMYRGPYAQEGPTIARLHAFIAEQGCTPAGKHHEIYLSDPRRTAPEKLKTVIRQPIAVR